VENVGKSCWHLRLQGDASHIYVSHGVFQCMWKMWGISMVGVRGNGGWNLYDIVEKVVGLLKLHKHGVQIGK
jgi:hypothetical protein